MIQGNSILPHSLSLLFQYLASITKSEGRAGGDRVSAALERHAASEIELHRLENPFSEILAPSLSLVGGDLGDYLRLAAPYIHWYGSDLSENRIPKSVADRMPMCELIGPDGMFFEADVRVGLWQQTAHVTYGPRRHAAEETFFILSGEAEWWNEDDGHQRLGAGRQVFHRSNVLHTTITAESPLFAIWRWSGAVGFQTYELTKYKLD